MNDKQVFALMIAAISGAGVGHRVITIDNSMTIVNAGHVMAFAVISANENKTNVVSMDNRVIEVEWGPEETEAEFQRHFLQAVISATHGC